MKYDDHPFYIGRQRQGKQGDKGDKGDTGIQGEKGDIGPKGLNGCTIMYYNRPDKQRIDFFVDSNGDGQITGDELIVGPFASAYYNTDTSEVNLVSNINASQLLGLTDINNLNLDKAGWTSVTEHTV